MRHLRPYFASLSLFGVLACATSSLDEPLTELPKNITEKIQWSMSNQDYSQAIRLTQDSKEPLFQLVHRKALYELEGFDTILQLPPIRDPRYQSYDTLVRALAAHDSKSWALLRALKVPNDLPRRHRDRIGFLKAEAIRESSPADEAIEAYRDFLKDYRGSAYETDAMVRLAQLLWDQNSQKESLEIYEKVYRQNPVGDGDDVARQRLMDSGRYGELDSEIHLSRIQKLQHAAMFERAEHELEVLRDKASPDDFERIDLATAKLLFANRKYSKSESAARRGLKTYEGSKKETDWRELLALSLTRQGDKEEGVQEYQKILRTDIPGSLREIILFRLGSIALDNDEFGTAAEYFKKLREEFPEGNFIESAHWFGSWAAFQEYRVHQKDWTEDQRRNNLKIGIRLLTKLADLPEGAALQPQALYWISHFHHLLKDDEKKTASLQKLKTEFNLSFYNLLLKDNSFSFLEEQRIRSVKNVSKPVEPMTHFRHELNWQRLESFRSVGLQSWAQPELDIFLASSKGQGSSFQTLVADRLTQIQDWADLVKWADRHFEKPLSTADLQSPTARYHYPLAYRDSVTKAAREFDLSPFLIWGLMREESRFEDGAISRVGAVGLMQIMPSLGDRIGRTLGEGSINRRRLADPKRNIRYGAYHIQELQKRVEKLDVIDELRPVLIVAAYNAGIEAVQRWLRENDSSSVDVFVDSIPFTETRGYVKRVLQSASIYFQLYGEADREVARTRGKQDL